MLCNLPLVFSFLLSSVHRHVDTSKIDLVINANCSVFSIAVSPPPPLRLEIFCKRSDVICAILFNSV